MPLDSSVPAHQALKQVIAMKSGRCSGRNWRRLPVLVVLERMDTADWQRNNNQLETDVAECRGMWTSWRAVATTLNIYKFFGRNGPQLSTRHE